MKTGKRPFDDRLAMMATFANLSKEIIPWVRSTGFRTHDFRYRSLGHSDDARVAEDFLVNSRLVRDRREVESSIVGYFSDPSAVMLSLLGEENSRGRREVSLPKSVMLQMGLGEVIARRRSVRIYTGDGISLEYLATILRSAEGVTGLADVQLRQGGQVTFRLRSTPSGGGLFPVDLYIATLNVRGLDRSIYRFDPLKDILVETGNSGAAEDLLRCLAVPDEVISKSQAAGIFLLVGHPWRSMRKYGNRGMRLLLLEAGAIAEHINLAALALGFGSVDCASFYDDEVHELMHLDGLYRAVLHAVIVGYPG